MAFCGARYPATVQAATRFASLWRRRLPLLAENPFAARKVKRLMTNPVRQMRFRRDHRWTPGHLSAYLEGDLVARSAARVRRHVRECPECRAALRSLERMLGLLRRAPPVSETERPDIAAGVRRRLRDPSAR